MKLIELMRRRITETTGGSTGLRRCFRNAVFSRADGRYEQIGWNL